MDQVIVLTRKKRVRDPSRIDPRVGVACLGVVRIEGQEVEREREHQQRIEARRYEYAYEYTFHGDRGSSFRFITPERPTQKMPAVLEHHA